MTLNKRYVDIKLQRLTKSSLKLTIRKKRRLMEKMKLRVQDV